jgi:hypothetical protein
MVARSRVSDDALDSLNLDHQYGERQDDGPTSAYAIMACATRSCSSPRTSKVVVTCAMLTMGCSNPRDPALAPPIAVASPDAEVVWGQASEVSGTQVMRVDLIRGRTGGGSSGYAELTNILFLDPDEKAGRFKLSREQVFDIPALK